MEAEEFSPKTDLKSQVATRAELDGGVEDLLSRTGRIVKRRDAVGLTTAVAGAATLAEVAGAVAPADPAGTDVPAVAGTKFSTVAEVYSTVVDIEGDPSIIRTDRQRSTAFLE